MILKHLLCAAGFLVAANGAAATSIRCGEPVQAEVEKEGDQYKFAVATKCVITDPGAITFAELLPHFQREYAKIPSMVSFGETPETVDANGLLGFAFPIKEAFKTQHGDLNISSRAIFVGNESNFIFESRSTDITATSYAKYTKVVNIKVQITAPDAEGMVIKITKRIAVEKPGIAPVSIFQNKTKEGLNADMGELKDRFSGMITGILDRIRMRTEA